MRTYFSKLLVTIVTFCLSINLYTQNVFIPDTSFKAELLADININKNGDAEISIVEAQATRRLTLNNKNIKNLKGIEEFGNLSELYCDGNSIDSINLSQNSLLEQVTVLNNPLVAVTFGNHPLLHSLGFNGTPMTSIDISNLSFLWGFNCDFCKLERLDLRGNERISQIVCKFSDIDTVMLPNNHSNLTLIDFQQSNKLSYLQLDSVPNLTELICIGGSLKSIDVSSAISLKRFAVDGEFSSLDISKCADLESFYIGGSVASPIPFVNFVGLLKIKDITLVNVDSASLGTHPNLSTISLNGFYQQKSLNFSSFSSLSSVVFQDCFKLVELNIANGNKLNNAGMNFVDLRGASLVSCVTVDDTAYANTQWTQKGINTTFSLNCSSLPPTPSPIPVYIASSQFKSNVLSNNSINLNGDTVITVAEAKAFTGFLNISNLGIGTLKGLEYFTNLTGLECSFNDIDSIDISANTKLTYFKAYSNKLVFLNAANSNNENITVFDASKNKSLPCIEVDDTAYANAVFKKDATVSFSTDCSSIVGLPVEWATKTNVSIYPNPANSVVFVKGLNNSDVSYTVLNMHGQFLLTGKLSGIEGSINVEELDAGSYFIKFSFNAQPQIESLVITK